MKVVLLAGGVGGARLAFGMARALAPEDLTVVVNVGDDFTHLGLRVCPDLDTVTYTLAGLENRETGWGIDGDSFDVLEGLARLGGPDWFRLGDRDLATHLHRTSLLAEGATLTEATARISRALGVGPRILPASDQPVPTRVVTDEGTLDFQDYFVRQRCEPRVSCVLFEGIETAQASGAVLEALAGADGIVIAPSNPFVSIEPVLALPAGAAPGAVRDLVASRPAVAVSPIVGGAAIKGPAAKMLQELGLDVSAAGVARRYAGVVGGYVMDVVDAGLAPAVTTAGMTVRTAQSIMRSDTDRERLARECLALLGEVRAVRA